MATSLSIGRRVDLRLEAVGMGHCWLWRGALNRTGYGTVTWRGRKWLAHRAVYTSIRGEIPEGLTLDHLCRVRRCVNPAHLEPVTQRVNTLRGDALSARRARATRCHGGHPLSGTNLFVEANGSRRCKTCKARNRSAWRQRVKARGGRPS